MEQLLGTGMAGGESFEDCIEFGATCTSTDGVNWTPEPDTGFGADSFDGIFVFFFIVAAIAGVVGLAVRLSMARKMADDAGLDKGHATAMTLLTGDEGLSATYLASSLRQSRDPGERDSEKDTDKAKDKEAVEAPQPIADRFRALERLRDEGLITTGEYDERRTRILDNL